MNKIKEQNIQNLTPMRTRWHTKNNSNASNQKQQSYLLQSYNQNQSLFANLNHYQSSDITQMLAHSKNSNKQYQYNGASGNENKESCGKDRKIGKGNKKDMGYGVQGVLHVGMLESVCEDVGEDFKTGQKSRANSRDYGGKTSTTDSRNEPSPNIAYKQLLKQSQSTDTQPITVNRKARRSQIRTSKQKGQSKKQLHHKHNKHDNEQDNGYEDGQLIRRLGQSNVKIKQLMQFIEVLCGKYSGLTRILQQYEEIIQQQTSQIQSMNSLLNILSKQYTYYTNKLQAFSNKNQEPTQYYGQYQSQQYGQYHSQQYGQYQHDIGAWLSMVQNVKKDIIGIVMFKYQKFADFGNARLDGRVMNCTKSVPLLTIPMHTQTNQNQLLKPQYYEYKQSSLKYNQHYCEYNQPQSLVLQSHTIMLKHEQYTPKLVPHSQNIPKPMVQPFQICSHKPKSQCLLSFNQSHQLFISPTPTHCLPAPLPSLPPSPQCSSQQTPYYRRLANIRIKQLQSQKTNLQNQLHSNTYKVIVLRNENRELKDIVQGLIVEIKKMSQDKTSSYLPARTKYQM